MKISDRVIILNLQSKRASVASFYKDNNLDPCNNFCIVNMFDLNIRPRLVAQLQLVA